MPLMRRLSLPADQEAPGCCELEVAPLIEPVGGFGVGDSGALRQVEEGVCGLSPPKRVDDLLAFFDPAEFLDEGSRDWPCLGRSGGIVDRQVVDDLVPSLFRKSMKTSDK